MALLGRKMFAILTRTVPRTVSGAEAVLQWPFALSQVPTEELGFLDVLEVQHGRRPAEYRSSKQRLCYQWICSSQESGHLSCMFPLGVRKYPYTTRSTADATKENKSKEREDIREGGRRGKEEQREEQREDKPIQHPRTGFCHMLPCSVGCLTEFMIYWPMEFWEMVSVLLQLYR